MITKKTVTRLLGVAGLVAALPAPTYALGEILASFPAPAPNPRALAYGGGYLHCFTATSPYLFWKLNAATGQVVASFPFAPTGAATCGLAFDGNYYWAGNTATDYIYRFREGGSVVSSFRAQWDVGQGLTWTGFHIWATTPKENSAYKFIQARADGFVIHSFFYYDYPYQPASGGSYLWVGNEDEYFGYYFVTAIDQQSGTYIGSFSPPAAEPAGLAYGAAALWLATTANNGWLWKIKSADVTVAPKSLGRIKALFR